jgi:RNA polymerase sigma-70 factor, ECF subfamily
MIGQETDEELLAQVAQRDQFALRQLMDRHMERAIALAERIVGGNADADDIAQEAFLRVWSKAEIFDPSAGRFTTWMYRIVFNLALDRRRAMKVPVPIENVEDIPLNGPGQLDALVADEEGSTISRALTQLSARQRAAIALFHMDGLSCREAGDIMGLSESAFDSLLNRARKALKQEVLATYGRLETHDD